MFSGVCLIFFEMYVAIAQSYLLNVQSYNLEYIHISSYKIRMYFTDGFINN